MSKLDRISKRKKTLATTYRGDSRTIATIVKYFKDRGEPVISLNDAFGWPQKG